MQSAACPECEQGSNRADLSGKHIPLSGTLGDTSMKGLLTVTCFYTGGIPWNHRAEGPAQRANCIKENEKDSDVPETNHLCSIGDK